MSRAGITPQIVVARAIAVIDEGSVADLTLARIADELGVSAPSLYKHIGGLEDLLERVAVSVTEEFARRLGHAIRAKAGRDALAAFAVAYREFVRNHPATYPFTQQRLSSTEWQKAADDALDSLVAILSGYESVEAEIDRIRLFRSTLHGFVDLERNGGFGFPASVDQTFNALIDQLDHLLRIPQSLGGNATTKYGGAM